MSRMKDHWIDQYGTRGTPFDDYPGPEDCFSVPFTDSHRYPTGYVPSHRTDIRKTFARIRRESEPDPIFGPTEQHRQPTASATQPSTNRN